ncbi:MAG: hypothetical protein IKB07_06145 [Lachnospiraceae bacterium]|nr:hypothetical protein [Lachnospiraceae bacterium]
MTDWQDRICGTKTAKAFWEEKLQMRRQFYEALQAEMQGTLEMEAFLKGGFRMVHGEIESKT